MKCVSTRGSFVVKSVVGMGFFFTEHGSLYEFFFSRNLAFSQRCILHRADSEDCVHVSSICSVYCDNCSLGDMGVHVITIPLMSASALLAVIRFDMLMHT